MGTKRKKTVRRRMSPASMLMVGASEKTVAAAKAAVLEIARQKANPDVLVQALKTFEKICSVENTSIHHCTFIAK